MKYIVGFLLCASLILNAAIFSENKTYTLVVQDKDSVISSIQFKSFIPPKVTYFDSIQYKYVYYKINCYNWSLNY